MAELDDVSEINQKILNSKDELITTIKIKKGENGNTKKYDENGDEINAILHFLLTEYEEKLSIRQIDLKYDQSSDSFSIIDDNLIR